MALKYAGPPSDTLTNANSRPQGKEALCEGCPLYRDEPIQADDMDVAAA